MARAKQRRLVKLENGNRFVKSRSTEDQSKLKKVYRESGSRTLGNKRLNSEGKNNSRYRNKNPKQQNTGRGKFTQERKDRGPENRKNKPNRTFREPKKVSKKDILQVNESGNPNSCFVYFGRDRYRTLIDTGADICVMSEKIYKKCKVKKN